MDRNGIQLILTASQVSDLVLSLVGKNVSKHTIVQINRSLTDWKVDKNNTYLRRLQWQIVLGYLEPRTNDQMLQLFTYNTVTVK